MNKRTAGVVNSARPNWQRNVLSKAIAMAGAGLQASAAMAACPTTAVNSAQTATCVVSTGQTATITNTGSITANPAIGVTGTGSQAVVNDGTLSGAPQAIFDNGSGTLTITNNASGVISGQGVSGHATTIYINGGADLVLDNSGMITAGGSSTSSAGAIAMGGSLGAGGSIANSGEISASAFGTGDFTSHVWAGGIWLSGDLAGSVDNSGSITAEASGSNSTISATGIHVGGSEGGVLSGSLTNSGSISASAAGTSSAGVRAAGIYVNGELSGSITNSGTVAATASGGSFNTAMGIFLDGLTGTLTNSGEVTASAAGGFFSVALGLFDVGGITGGSLTNEATGSIAATAEALAFGIYIPSPIDADASLTNAGTVSATANASSSESAYATGIGLSSVAGTIDNSGTVSATATGNADASAQGISAYSLDVDASLTNGGTINAAASSTSGASFANTASADGIFVFQSVAGTIDNSGSIVVDAWGTSASSSGFGVGVGIYLNQGAAAGASITNSGSIDVTAGGDGGEGAGVFAVNSIAGAIENDGEINVDVSAAWTATAGGIVGYASMASTGSISNSGAINVNATASGTSASAYAAGIYVSGAMAGSASITNSGAISVTSTAGFDGAEGYADGIYVYSMQSGSSLVNSGSIDVTGGSSVYVFGGSESLAGGAAGIWVSNLRSGATLTNSGTINANTTAGPGTGWAMVVANGTSGEGQGFPIISNTGTLRGNVLLNGASLDNAGLLSIPVSDGTPGTFSYINGDYTQMAGGILEIGALSNTMYGRLIVSGTADFTASGHFAVNVAPYDLLSAGDVLDNVVTAVTSLNTDSNLFVTDNSPFWQFTASDDGEGGIDLLVSGQPRGFLTAAGAQVMNVNLDALQGEVMGRMDVTRLIRREGGHAQNLWFRPYGSWASVDDNGNNSVGYDNDTYGMVIGYDTYLDGSDWNFGGAFSYAQSNVDGKSSLSNDKIETDLYSGSIYAYGNLDPDTFVDLLAIGGWGSNDTKRNLGVNGTATGDYDSWYARLSAAIGRNFQMNEQWTFTPKGSVIYTYVDEDSYKEKGPSGLTLDVDSTDADSLIFMLDAIFSYQLNPGALLTAHAGGGYDALADDLKVDASFVGGTTSFNIKTDGPDDWLAVAGIGAEFVASDTVEIHFNYDYEYRNDFDNNQVVATLRWKL